jgi:hypothetical protein
MNHIHKTPGIADPASCSDEPAGWGTGEPFMTLHQEDRFPIHDIMDQTPSIPGRRSGIR